MTDRHTIVPRAAANVGASRFSQDSSAWRRPIFGEQQRFMLLLVAPAAFLMLLFQVVPIVIGANASFRDWALYNPKKIWVGLAHYHSVITDPAFLYVVLPNTFIFMIVSVLGALVTGLGLALLLNRPFRGQKIVQTILLVPLMVAPVVAAIMIRWIFNDQFGIANVVLEAVGFDHYAAVLSDPAFLYVVLPNTFLFMVLSVAGALVAGLMLALLLNRRFVGQKLV